MIIQLIILLGPKPRRVNNCWERAVGSCRRWRRRWLVASEKLSRRRRLRSAQLFRCGAWRADERATDSDGGANLLLIRRLHRRQRGPRSSSRLRTITRSSLGHIGAGQEEIRSDVLCRSLWLWCNCWRRNDIWRRTSEKIRLIVNWHNVKLFQIIKLITKEPHGVDDGWWVLRNEFVAWFLSQKYLLRWEGELDGKFGNFPSLVVDECDENGEPLTEPEEEEEDDDDALPPAGFGLPPTVPPHLVPQDDFTASPEQQAAIEKKFEIDLSQTQQKQYKQFQAPTGICRRHTLPCSMTIKFLVFSFASRYQLI